MCAECGKHTAPSTITPVGARAGPPPPGSHKPPRPISTFGGGGYPPPHPGPPPAARVLAAIPHDRALLETDCPYMAPEPVRGTRNDSRNIVHVAAYIGTLWDMDAQAVLDQTAANARA